MPDRPDLKRTVPYALVHSDEGVFVGLPPDAAEVLAATLDAWRRRKQEEETPKDERAT